MVFLEPGLEIHNMNFEHPEVPKRKCVHADPPPIPTYITNITEMSTEIVLCGQGTAT